PKARHYLVENQNGAEMRCPVAHDSKKVPARRNTPHISADGLDNDAGDLIPPRIELLDQSLRVIERQNRGQLCETCRHSRTVGQPERRNTGTGFNQKAVPVSVIATVEFDNSITAREPTRQPYCAQGCLSSGIYQTHFLDGGNKLGYQLSNFDLALSGSTKGSADFESIRESLEDFGRPVTKDQWSPRADVVYKLPPVSIPDV